MRIHIRLNPSKEDDRLITRWLARYHRGARRQGVIKACLAAGARAFFAKLDPPSPPTAPAPEPLTVPVTIPTFAGLGALIQTPPTSRTTRPPGGPHDHDA